mgnify:CR=1 FL=1
MFKYGVKNNVVAVRIIQRYAIGLRLYLQILQNCASASAFTNPNLVLVKIFKENAKLLKLIISAGTGRGIPAGE